MPEATESDRRQEAERTELESVLREFLEAMESPASREDLYRVGNPRFVPKPAVVEQIAEPSVIAATPGESFTLIGEGRVPVDTVIGKRAAYMPDPINLDGVPYYLDAKGYGRNGQELYGSYHSEGDLWLGMFMESAEREYGHALELQRQGFDPIQRSVALLRFETDEFARSVLMNLFGDIGHDRARRRYDAEAYRSAMTDILECWSRYQADGRDGIRSWIAEFGYATDLVGLIDGREAGYVLRAMRSPFRVGDLKDPAIVTERNRMIAERMGDLTRRLLEAGYWNLSPNPGNWTRTGELVDFEDVIRVADELHLAEDDQRRREFATRREHLAFTLGSGTTGLLAEPFRHGFAGRPASDDEVAALAEEILET